MRRRRFRRTFAGKRGGRSFYWYRFGAFNLTARGTPAGAVFSDIILTESDWANPSVASNETKRGGPRLERFIMDYGMAIEANSAFWQTASGANIALIPEFMVWKQSDQFATSIINTAGWDATRDNSRVLMDEIPHLEREFHQVATGVHVRSVQGHYETKSKVRLSEGALGCAIRSYMDLTDADVLGFTDWIRPTILISVP